MDCIWAVEIYPYPYRVKELSADFVTDSPGPIHVSPYIDQTKKKKEMNKFINKNLGIREDQSLTVTNRFPILLCQEKDS